MNQAEKKNVSTSVVISSHKDPVCITAGFHQNIKVALSHRGQAIHCLATNFDVPLLKHLQPPISAPVASAVTAADPDASVGPQTRGCSKTE